MLYIKESFILGKQFVLESSNNNSSTQYTCIGYASNETFLVVGSAFDSVNNRSIIKTFKIQEVKFIGDLSKN